MIKCGACDEQIKGQYIYEVKLDDGKIVQSHGGQCLKSWDIKRIPIKEPDWWVRQVGQTCPSCGQIIR